MDTSKLIQRLNELAEWSSNHQEVPNDMAITLYRAAATIGVLRNELKFLLDKEGEI